MGAGRTRGGPGPSFVLTPRDTGQIDNYGYGDGIQNPPHGLFGGKPGDGGALYRQNEDGTKRVFSAFAYFRVHEGETWCAMSTGGGGYGDPLERGPDRVRIDVRDGFVSLRSAEEDYGVVIDRGRWRSTSRQRRSCGESTLKDGSTSPSTRPRPAPGSTTGRCSPPAIRFRSTRTRPRTPTSRSEAG